MAKEEIDFERNENGRISGIQGKSHSPTKINYSLLLWIARLSESLDKFSSSSDNNSKKMTCLTWALIFLGIVQIFAISLSIYYTMVD